MSGYSLPIRLIALAPPAAGLLFLAFYAHLFREYNAALPFEGPAVEGHLGDYRLAIDRCWSSVSKISIAGWVAKPGLHRNTHATRVLIRDDAGRTFQLKTDLPNRKDVTTYLNRVLGDHVNYDNSGFTASLNLRQAGRGISQGRLLIAFDEGGRYVLLPTTCTYSASP